MERNALLAVVISLLILVLWNEFVIKQYSPRVEPGHEIAAGPGAAAPPGATASGTDSRAVGGADATSDVAAPPQPPAAPEAPSVAKSESEPVVDRPVGSEVVVQTDLFRAVFTTAGARLQSLQLNKYRERVGVDSPLQELVHPAPGAPLPLAVHLRGKTETSDDSGVLYEVDRRSLNLVGGESGSISFTGRLDGARITKRFALVGNSYLWSMDVELDGAPDYVSEVAVPWDGLLGKAGGRRSGVIPTANPFNDIAVLEADELIHESRDKLATGVSFDDATTWIGFSGQYFFAGLITENEEVAETTHAWASAVGDSGEAMLRIGGQPAHTSVVLYTGPKDIDELDAAGHSLRRALDLGWFTIVALPMLQALRYMHVVSGNYGIDIIVLTIFIKLLFYPLTKKSFQSMKGMQKLQPRMERLKENYKDKPDELNKAMMELYRSEGVNPLGGCLPMFLQMPVFIGLYNALLSAVELRHAPFAFWIQDLAAPDRLGSVQLPFVHGAGFPVLTIIMGVSMLVQQRMTPSTSADPMQQRMMMLMPVVFTFMFINFPAGLTLYWLANNLLTIGQQYMINRQED